MVNLAIDLVEQRFYLRGIAGVLIRQRMSNDLTAIGIQRQMEFSLATSGFCTMLFLQPLSGAVDFQPGAVDQHMQWAIRQRSISFA